MPSSPATAEQGRATAPWHSTLSRAALQATQPTGSQVSKWRGCLWRYRSTAQHSAAQHSAAQLLYLHVHDQMAGEAAKGAGRRLQARRLGACRDES